MNIRNESELITIEIFGTIGESWFEEGITMQLINDQLKEAKNKPIKLVVSSLGGDVTHALAIHDLLKMHNAPVTAEIIGATASSGTIVAMGANEVNMSENALFLVHNAWTVAMGNANDFREAAEDLDRWDARIVDIYRNKTGKRKSQVYSLMEEEKWIDSKEAKEFGFIDNSFKPKSAAASILNEDQKKQILNDIRNQFKMKKFDKINDILEVEELVMDEEKGVYLNEAQLESIETALIVDNSEAIATAVTAAEETHQTEKTTLIEAHTEALTEVSDKAKLEKTEYETALNAEKEKVTAEIAAKEELKTKFDEMESNYNRVTAKGTIFLDGEPYIEGDKLSVRDQQHAENAKEMAKKVD